MQTRLIGMRKYHNYTQKQMAELLGISSRSYIDKENGKTEFKMNEMFKLSKHLNIPIDSLFFPTYFTSRERSE